MPYYQSIKATALAQLKEAFPELHQRFGVTTIGLFGSVSRGEDRKSSDINILYMFAEDRGDLSDFIGLHEYLELMFHRNVMLVSLEYLDKEMLPSIRRDACLFGEKTEYL
ncbi:MAG TPA: nucleotidyltransferase domain-containing protein [Methanocorpusculum sp.]|nr:nucleotidyltransferase domain-containing protein [Methanocorpusculum sp.]